MFLINGAWNWRKTLRRIRYSDPDVIRNTVLLRGPPATFTTKNVHERVQMT